MTRVFHSLLITAEFFDVFFFLLEIPDSDSDMINEQLTGNIHKIAIVPPNFSGRPKKGHLIFDACFECGNLGRVDYISDFEYDLFIRPDTCNPRFRIWFNFTVENVKQDQVRSFRSVYGMVKELKVKLYGLWMVHSGSSSMWSTSASPSHYTEKACRL